MSSPPLEVPQQSKGWKTEAHATREERLFQRENRSFQNVDAPIATEGIGNLPGHFFIRVGAGSNPVVKKSGLTVLHPRTNLRNVAVLTGSQNSRGDAKTHDAKRNFGSANLTKRFHQATFGRSRTMWWLAIRVRWGKSQFSSHTTRTHVTSPAAQRIRESPHQEFPPSGIEHTSQGRFLRPLSTKQKTA